MTTIRSFACEQEEGAPVLSFARLTVRSMTHNCTPHGTSVRLYRAKLDEYYGLNKREGRAYGAYAVATTLLPNLVIALVLFYGGQLVLNNDDGMTSGKLVRG